MTATKGMLLEYPPLGLRDLHPCMSGIDALDRSTRIFNGMHAVPEARVGKDEKPDTGEERRRDHLLAKHFGCENDEDNAGTEESEKSLATLCRDYAVCNQSPSPGVALPWYASCRKEKAMPPR